MAGDRRMGNNSRATEASASRDPSQNQATTSQSPVGTRKNRRGGRKKGRNRTKSFIAPSDDLNPTEGFVASSTSRDDYFRRRSESNTSLDSEALLDHRDQDYPRRRRGSVMLPNAILSPAISRSHARETIPPRIGDESDVDGDNNDDDDDNRNEEQPLLAGAARFFSNSTKGYGSSGGLSRPDRLPLRRGSSRSSRRAPRTPRTPTDTFNVNYPPSVPASPALGASDHPELMFAEDRTRSPGSSKSVNGDLNLLFDPSGLERRHTVALHAEEDVCFPQDVMSEMGDDPSRDSQAGRTRRRRRNKWPDLSILNDWSRMEKEGHGQASRMKKITEPQLVDGRLRPIHKRWYSAEEDAPYRFTYFNENFQSTIHSQTISELVQSDTGFKELFIPEPPLLSDSSDSESDDEEEQRATRADEPSFRLSTQQTFPSQGYAPSDRQSDAAFSPQHGASASGQPSAAHSENVTPQRPGSPFSAAKSPEPQIKQPRYGDRPVWWLDVLSPTESEMRCLQRTFGIHPLTAEDIMLQEQREKVELFRHYYFVNYRSFDQDSTSENHLEPVNMYVIVFREGVISFHFSQTPHPANVRRRIRQLKDFMVLSSDWIGYAIIDDITDVYLPLIQNIEDEVDDIDDAILELHSPSNPSPEKRKDRKDDEKGSVMEADSEGDMLRRVGDCRKKVMRLYRLLGNKADVIKGFAKRCNEHWEVAPRSEIGLYLGDIQDHIVTMTGNLSHYEMILARCHANYIAQINIRMNERSEATADGLNKLTVLGTIVLPMNIITGLWGMNVWVPGQEYEHDLAWFFCITAGLLLFGVACFYIAKKLYRLI